MLSSSSVFTEIRSETAKRGAVQAGGGEERVKSQVASGQPVLLCLSSVTLMEKPSPEKGQFQEQEEKDT